MKNFITLLLVLLLVACSSSGKKSVDKLYYRFPETSITSTASLIVKRPTAMGILGNRPMVAQTANGSLKQMHNNFWLDSPKVLLHNYLLKVFSTTPIENNMILESQILKLEKKQQQTALEIKFTLKDIKGKLVFSKTYSEIQNLDNNTISSFTHSVGQMLENFIKQLVNDIQ